jgi:hypothetical protein
MFVPQGPSAWHGGGGRLRRRPRDARWPDDQGLWLCAAIVDRLTFNGAIIQTGTESYRLAHTKAQAEQAQAS